MKFMELLERLIFKITSGRFVFTCVVAGVFAYMAITGLLKEDKTMEVILIVVYAYFSMNRKPSVNSSETNTTTTLPPVK